MKTLIFCLRLGSAGINRFNVFYSVSSEPNQSKIKEAIGQGSKTL